MASKIKAIGALRPKIVLGRKVQKTELIRYLASRTELNTSDIDKVLHELRDAIISYNCAGRSVKLVGLGTYTPKVALNGTFDINYRTATEIKNGLNAPEAFTGEIKNRDNIGKTGDDLAALWNAAHPDDLVS